MKDFYSVNNMVGFADADNYFGIFLKGTNESVFPFIR